jgi:hypothetical protein
MVIKQASRSGTPTRDQNSKKYRDRPADEGKHGDAGEEPSSGVPTSPEDAAGRPKPARSRQQTNANQVTQTGSPELEAQHSGHARTPKRRA